jgi:ribosomal protein S18 acetylase RimI-like enzyme
MSMTTLVAMTEAEYAAYVEAAIPSYAADKIASGQWSSEEALDLSRKSLQELLPDGLATPDNHLFTIQDDQARAVGMLWIAAQDRAGKRIAYVYDVSIKPEFQRKGHATRAFLAAEDKARALGLCGIALHVFGHNVGAQALYSALGYRATNISMYKPVGPAEA